MVTIQNINMIIFILNKKTLRKLEFTQHQNLLDLQVLVVPNHTLNYLEKN